MTGEEGSGGPWAVIIDAFCCEKDQSIISLTKGVYYQIYVNVIKYVSSLLR